MAEREAELLPVPYYHVVFTLPAPVADIAYHKTSPVQGIGRALITMAADPKHLGVPHSAYLPSCIRGVRRSLSSLGDFRTPAPEYVCTVAIGPASENLYIAVGFIMLREMSCDWLVTVLPLGARWAPQVHGYFALPRSSTRSVREAPVPDQSWAGATACSDALSERALQQSLPAAHELRAGPGAGGGEKIDENHEPRLSASG